ncbi:D-allose ABC transporter ATP-binding protein AlsA [Brevibacillus sp. SYP-B805]|uniref:D-allose ABC transporter ATP-binding protein AlsA n=1 Tax=Brevibacillus sp. SYP-B805 TaxID=1578199 RepID=UPI0013ED31B6|nr:D-allose ABC transporter ATP-binding protein AlsA [Brevibacillus sp. SYP-B805]NGQ96700.1 D-allose ABC transporter ATP-binding protein AlsA [Brevibacillus sp. SYP-B805]
MKPLVEMRNITKKFSGVTALENINFDILSGEVHILLGENGAGKSTLMKILSGIYEPTEGSIILSGREYSKLTPADSAENKISIIYQELSLIDELSIAENLFVGKLPTKKVMGIPVVDFAHIHEKTAELLKRVGLNRSPSTLVGELPISEKQQVEIAKALASDAKVIIMDEPTSSLTTEEVNKLFAIIRQLKKEGVGIVYISHKMKELAEIGDRVTVLKDGKHVGTKPLKDVTTDQLVSMMVGRELNAKNLNPHRAETNEVIFEVQHLTRKDRAVQDVSFKLYRGEILGFAGLIGSGRTELMNAIFGAAELESGDMTLFGEKVIIKSPHDAVKKGLAFITENRRETGFFHNFEIWKNISISSLVRKSKWGGIWGFVNKQAEQQQAEEQKKVLRIKCSSILQNITELSGGNQQKVIIGKWLAAQARLMIFDEPTRGIDVGAKSEIYAIMRKLANEGKGILMVSSELPELLAVCDRIIVFKDGRLRATFTNEEATEEKIMLAATSDM